MSKRPTREPYDPEANVFTRTGCLLDLDEFQGGRICATGTWERCQGGAGQGGVFGKSCERTFITLYHEPLP